MGQLLILITVALVAAALAWGVAVLLLGRDPGLVPTEPDGRAIPLPTARPLTEADIGALRFDTAARGYRMNQVDQALRRIGYDVGYKEELIGVLEAEVAALRDGRVEEADGLRRAREAAERPRTVDAPAELPADAPAEPMADAPAERVDEADTEPAADEPPASAAEGDAVATGARGSGAAGTTPGDGET